MGDFEELKVSFADLHDETRAYVYSHKDEVCKDAISMMSQSVRFIAVLFAAALLIAYMSDKDFVMRITYVILPIVLLFGYRLTSYLRRRPDTTLEKVRVSALLYYIVLYGVLSVIDLQLELSGVSFFIPIILVAFSVFYIDYFLVLVIMELSFFAVFIAENYILNTGDSLKTNILLFFVAMCVSLYCHWRILLKATQNAASEKNLKKIGSADQLTGLLNKMSFERIVQKYMVNREKDQDAVLFIIDFDNFKSVNDKYGHLTGDEILKKFGAILKKNFRDKDILGRVGGDEFMVMMTGKVPREIIETRAKKIQLELNVARAGDAGNFSCSIGIAVDNIGFNFKDLYKLSDDALYEAKARGKAQYVLWFSEWLRNTGDKKVAYILTDKQNLRNKAAEDAGDDYCCVTGDETTRALNEISLYQGKLGMIYMDYKMSDIKEEQLRKYMESRPVFSKIPVKDIEELV